VTQAGEPLGREADYASCEDLLRRNGRDLWLASLFIPQEKRRHVHALYAFDLETARVPEAVSEPLLGEIRLQWWRSALEGVNEGEALANPVAAALLDTAARCGLPRHSLLKLIDVRQSGIYRETPKTQQEIEVYTEAACATLFRLAARILDRENETSSSRAARPAGIAYGLVGLMRDLPRHHARGSHVFLPAEVLEAGATAGENLAALARLRDLARNHLDMFYKMLPNLPEKSRAAFLVICLCEPYLRLMEKPGYNPRETVIELPQWRRQWILWRTARRWGGL
jgi:phytoene synthase